MKMQGMFKVIFYIIGCLTRRIIEKVITGNRFVKEVNDEIIKEAEEENAGQQEENAEE